MGNYRKLLTHSDPNKRKQALIDLTQRGETDALEDLRWMAQHDPNPKLREMAKEAHDHIQQTAHFQYRRDIKPLHPSNHSHITRPDSVLSQYELSKEKPDVRKASKSWRQEMGVEANEADSDKKRLSHYQRIYEESQGKTGRQISEKDRQKAERLVKQAMSSQLNGNYQHCGDLLQDALTLNPSLRDDLRVKNMLSLVYGDDGFMEVQFRQEISGGRLISDQFNWNHTLNFLAEVGFWYLVLVMLTSTIFLGKIALIKNDLQELRAAYGQITPLEQRVVTSFDRAAGWDSPQAWIRVGMIYSAGAMFAIMCFAIFTWLVGLMFDHAAADMYVFIRAMMRGAIGVILFGFVFWGVTNQFSPSDAAGLMLAVIPVLAGIAVAAWYIGEGQQKRMIMGALHIFASVTTFFTLLWWITLFAGKLPGVGNSVDNILPMKEENIPVYYTTEDVHSGQQTTYTYPWNLLPLPPGLPLPERPIHEYLP